MESKNSPIGGIGNSSIDELLHEYDVDASLRYRYCSIQNLEKERQNATDEMDSWQYDLEIMEYDQKNIKDKLNALNKAKRKIEEKLDKLNKENRNLEYNIEDIKGEISLNAKIYNEIESEICLRIHLEKEVMRLPEPIRGIELMRLHVAAKAGGPDAATSRPAQNEHTAETARG